MSTEFFDCLNCRGNQKEINTDHHRILTRTSDSKQKYEELYFKIVHAFENEFKLAISSKICKDIPKIKLNWEKEGF